jgi:nicotinic acid mononucleotide adenylyltransferase
LKKQHPDKQFGFVIGSDLIEELKNWKHPVELHNEIRFIICNRKGFEIDKAHLPVHYTIIDVPPIELSSTDIITIFREHITAEEKVTRISDNLSEPALKLLKHKGLI